jgi:spermidine synthase
MKYRASLSDDHANKKRDGSRASLCRWTAFVVFFASGFAALLYQVIWQRLLVFFSGTDVYSVTLIVTTFMAG